MTEINLNDRVAVRLLPRGREQHSRFYRALNLPEPKIKEDSDGWSEWQLWELMNTIGPACYMGPEPPFETTMRILHQDESTGG